MDFSLEAVHAVFTDTTSRRLTLFDLLDGFKRIGVTCESSDCALVLARYDADADARLGFWEFANMFLPRAGHARRDLESRRNFGLSNTAHTRLGYLVKSIIETETRMEQLRIFI